MFGKNKKVLAKINVALEKKTAKLDDSEKRIFYIDARNRIAVKKALDKAKIFDLEKRTKIHKIMKSMSNRTKQLMEFGRIKTIQDASLIIMKDPFIGDCRNQVIDELGPAKASKFFLSQGWQAFVLGIKIRPRKKPHPANSVK